MAKVIFNIENHKSSIRAISTIYLDSSKNADRPKPFTAQLQMKTHFPAEFYNHPFYFTSNDAVYQETNPVLNINYPPQDCSCRGPKRYPIHRRTPYRLQSKKYVLPPLLFHIILVVYTIAIFRNPSSTPSC